MSICPHPVSNGVNHDDDPRPVVGLIPAAGLAKRLGLLNSSKEIISIASDQPGGCTGVVSEFLIKQMVRAGCRRAFFIIRPGKWDIVEHFGNGAAFGLPIGYLMMGAPYGPPFTISQASPFIKDTLVLTGFPDILLDPPDVCEQVVNHLRRSQADVVIGTFPGGPESGCDLADVDSRGHVSRIVPKEYKPVWRQHSRVWLVAAWRPSFTGFLTETVTKLTIEAETMSPECNPEWPFGAVLAKGLEAGLDLRAVHFKDGRFLDIGTPERLSQAARFIARLGK